MKRWNVSSTRQDLEHTWFLDSGCSRHMNGLKFILKDFVEKNGPIVVFGDSSEGVVKGFGTIKEKAIGNET